MEHITETEIERLRSTKSETEWNAVCDEIKRARGGKYPKDWWRRVIMGGVFDTARTRWS